MDDLTLLHHVAFSGNIEALNAISQVPYFKEVLDESSNEVGMPMIVTIIGRMDPIVVGRN